MHLLVRDTRTLDETSEAVDLGHAPADLLFLSFSDSDLAAAAAAWRSLPEPRPSLRLANLAQLRHPMSVDLYVEQVVRHARVVVVRLLGGVEYWRYGAEEVAAICRQRGIPLALIPGDVRDDPRLAEMSTVAPEALARLDAYFAHGGGVNLQAALRLAAHLAGLGPDPAAPPDALDGYGEHRLRGCGTPGGPVAVILFYRSQLLAGDIAPIEALAAALAARGLCARALFVASPKDPAAAAYVADRLRAWRAAVVLNATFFSAPLETAVPVLQLLQPGAAREAWAESARGLSQADLAMQVVLPELDGRLLTAAISFKAPQPPVAGLDFAGMAHVPDADGIALAADRAAGWARLAATPRSARRIAIVLSDYPGDAGQTGHAVGLDSFASLHAMLADLHAAGYDCGDMAALDTRTLCEAPADVVAYRFAALPAVAQDRMRAAWGEPPATVAIRMLRAGNVILAVQPDRGSRGDRKSGYHDPDLPPCHDFAGFYLWLRGEVEAIVHMGAHGTLEWLPGKAVALSASCFPTALLGGLPVIYPFIVNNPGEAAAAKRRLGAVTIGHLTPPLRAAGTHGPAAVLERLIDDYAAADGMDRRRTAALKREIIDTAAGGGLLAESGVAPGTPEDEALARLDAYLCDVKELQIRDGLHVFGRPPSPTRRALLLDALQAANPAVGEAVLAARLDASPAAETAALLAALDGRFVPPGPAGAPTRGRADVLPTGRNLCTIDPRGVPTRAAMTLAERSAAELLRRHLQDHGDWPRSLVIDLWGSATMRTGGEDFALALVLLGARPLWDDGSNRVAGIEILPLALLDRPRIDVTLRISGLFRDAFEAQIALFDSAVQAVAARDEAADWNPLAAHGGARPLRVFGPAAGCYGAGDDAAAYLDASGHAYGIGLQGRQAATAFADRVATAHAFVHQQDHGETDLLDSVDYALHEGGFAAAAAALGGSPALYHTDTSRPDAPKVRSLAEEIARIVRGRAANPAWIAGMMPHGFRGAAEIARAADALYAFAVRLPTRLDAQFELLFDATLGREPVDRFLRDANPRAHAAMQARFRDAIARELWRPRRNATAALLDEASP
jgi:cobaltochelatase CobN